MATVACAVLALLCCLAGLAMIVRALMGDSRCEALRMALRALRGDR